MRWKYDRRKGGGDRDTEESGYGSGSDGSQDTGIETGDAHVGELSCMAALRSRRKSGQGRVQASSPDGKQAEGGERRSGLRIVIILQKN